jgi:Tol biopolymer transport system component
MKEKRIIFFLLGLALGVASIWAMVQSQSTPGEEKPEVPAESSTQVGKFETILIGKGGAPRWSLDGTKIAFISEDGWLTIADAEGKGEYKKVAPANFGSFYWMDSTTFLTTSKDYEEENGKKVAKILRLKTLTAEGKESLIKEDISGYHQPHKVEAPSIEGPIFLKDGTVGYYEGPFFSPKKDKVFKVIKGGKLKLQEAIKELMATTPDGYVGTGPILLESIDGSIKKVITKTKTAYSFPQLSPDGTKIATIDMRGSIVVMDTSGNELANIGGGDILKRGPAGCWSPDSKLIVYQVTKESEYDIEESEIFIVNWDGTGKKQITNTPDEIELEPSWSPDGTMIACVSLNTGKIFVIKVK